MSKKNNNSLYEEGYLQGIIDSTWKCFDCGNMYESLVEDCPNKLLDDAQAKLRGAKYRENFG